MPLAFDEFPISSLHALAQRAVNPQSPKPLRLGAARGLLPGVSPRDIVSTVALLTSDSEEQVASTAVETLQKLPEPLIKSAFQEDLDPCVLHAVAQHNANNEPMLIAVVANTQVDPQTVTMIAESASENVCERIALNEQRLLQCPAIIEKLYLNPNTRMSTADRILDLAVRHGIELDIPAFEQAAAAIRQELICEPSETPTPDDLIYKRITVMAQQVSLNPDGDGTDIVQLNDEGEEVVEDEALPLWLEISRMSPSQKIRRAVLGTDAERMLLVRDPNQYVAVSAIRSPKMRENFVQQIASSRSVCTEVLRIIANNREWVSNYQVKYSLVTNPRTPISFVARLIVHLREHELRLIAKSKNVPANVASAAKRQLGKRQP